MYKNDKIHCAYYLHGKVVGVDCDTSTENKNQAVNKAVCSKPSAILEISIIHTKWVSMEVNNQSNTDREQKNMTLTWT